MKQPDTSALRERLAGYTSEQDIQELDGLTEKISGQINGLHNLLDEIKDLREEMHGIHESLRHTLQRERTAFNALTAAKDSAENIVDGICNAIVKAEQHTVIKAEVSTAELEKINQWSAAHIKAEEEICGESDESDPRESGVKVAPLKSHEKTRFKRHFHRQPTRTMRLNKYNYSKIGILFDTQHLSEGLSMEFDT